MRALALAAAVGLAAFAGAAAAKDWNDPAGRVKFTTPANWTLDTSNSTAELTHLVVGTANNECQIVALPREQTASATAAQVRRAAGTQIAADAWTGVANSMPRLFNNAATVTSQSVDTSSFWPVQRAELAGPEHPKVYGAIQIRPGLEIWTFCLTYDGPDTAAVYETVIRSVGTANDATLQAQAEQQDAERAAQQAAAATAQQNQQQQQQQQPQSGEVSRPNAGRLRRN